MSEIPFIPDKPYLKVSEVVDILNLTTPTIYKLIKEKKLPGVQIGSTWRIPRKNLLNFLRTINGEK